SRYWPAAQKGEQRQIFYNPYWELDLTLARNAKNEPVLRGKITNISRRKLPLGMQFDVEGKREGFQKDVGVATFVVGGEPRSPRRRDGGDAKAGKFSLDIKETPSLAQAAPDGLFGVRQEFTWRTAPVKRLDAMALFRHSHRTANIPLKPAWQFPQPVGDA